MWWSSACCLEHWIKPFQRLSAPLRHPPSASGGRLAIRRRFGFFNLFTTLTQPLPPPHSSPSLYRGVKLLLARYIFKSHFISRAFGADLYFHAFYLPINLRRGTIKKSFSHLDEAACNRLQSHQSKRLFNT